MHPYFTSQLSSDHVQDMISQAEADQRARDAARARRNRRRLTRAEQAIAREARRHISPVPAPRRAPELVDASVGRAGSEVSESAGDQSDSAHAEAQACCA